MIGVTTAIILDTRVPRKNDTYSVKLRITYNRSQKYYPINIFLTKDDWQKTQNEKTRKVFKEHKLYFNKIEARAIEIIKSLASFSFTSFERNFDDRKSNPKDIISLFKIHIVKLNEEGRPGTAESYKCASNSFLKFLKYKHTKVLNFSEVTVDWLNQYENWMVSQDNSPTTTGIYLRSLRTVFNIAIDNGSLSRELYPFGKRKFVIPASRNIKKALQLSDIKRIIDYQTFTEAETRARDLWIFSYLCNGANMKDIAKLKYRNINETSICFYRQKTKRTSKQDSKPIVVMLIPEIMDIVAKWGSKPTIPDTYVFSVLEKFDSGIIEVRKIQQMTKTINKYMKRIGESLKIEIPLTTYTARHSFATILKRAGAPIEFISESLGHKDIRTTENYLDSFESETKLAFQKQLLNF